MSTVCQCADKKYADAVGGLYAVAAFGCFIVATAVGWPLLSGDYTTQPDRPVPVVSSVVPAAVTGGPNANGSAAISSAAAVPPQSAPTPWSWP